MGENHLQERVMQSLSRLIGSDEAVSKWLQEVLDLEYSTARRKFTGHIKISLEQYEKIIQAAPIVLAETSGRLLGENTFLTTYSGFRNRQEVNEYLHTIIKRFEEALKHKARLKYVARDLPLFFFLAERRLAEFKISLWSHQLGDKGLMSLDIETMSLCREVYRLYCHLPSVEVWNHQVLTNQPRMIDWFCDLKRINSSYRQQLYDALTDQLSAYKAWSETGQKNGHGAIELLFTDFITMNNGGLLELEKSSYLMTAISSVNFVTFTDPRLCKRFTEEFEQHRAYATSVSRHNALARERSFEKLFSELNAEP